MAFHPDYDGARLSNENRAWGKFYADGLDQIAHDVTAPTRPRRLRIGYLSYEYATHVTSFYFEPLARRHDRERFEVFCYAGNEKKDGTTERLSRFVDHWVDISSLDAEAAARRVASPSSGADAVSTNELGAGRALDGYGGKEIDCGGTR